MRRNEVEELGKMTGNPGRKGEIGAGARRGWLDVVRAVALLWIVGNHVVERIFGYPYMANPGAGWPPLAERIAQMRPLPLDGFLWLPVNAIRYLGWLGDQGVQLFLIAGGFGLTWSLLQRGAPTRLDLAAFYRKRAARILPLWWGAHLLFAATSWWFGWGMSPRDPRFLASFLGIRVTASQFYFFSPAWWYIGLLIQLYLVYPWLWSLLRRRGAVWLLAGVGGGSLLVRGAGLLYFESYLDVWQRGGILVSRLPEFLLGMALAAWCHRDESGFRRRLRAPGTLALAAAAWLAGLALSFFLVGMTVAPLLQGTAAFVLLHAALSGRGTGRGFLNRHDLSLYLLHHPLILLLLPEGAREPRVLVPSMAALLLVWIVGSPLLERVVAGVRGAVGRAYRRGWLAAAVGSAVLVFLLVAPPLAAEWALRRWDPQEVNGWGERPALEPDAAFGWRLAPSRTTRLRWVSYDYEVQANSLGFPGPEPQDPPAPGALRILVTGDAFSSAEGVDTADAWPRLLETVLRERLSGRPVEVLNLAITGYGPRQELAVLERFVPEFRPDRIIVQMFVNDLEDVRLSDEEFRESIGFGRPRPVGLRSLLHRGHLRRFLELRLLPGVRWALWGEIDPDGWFLGQFSALERRPPGGPDPGAPLLSEHLARMRDLAEASGAELLLALVPAPTQVCDAKDLDYFPAGVSLADTAHFDLDRPQRTISRIAGELGIPFLDLRPALRAGPSCPYQPRNLHWTAEGHRIAADALAGRLLPDLAGY